jgi:hypothetical protein
MTSLPMTTKAIGVLAFLVVLTDYYLVNFGLMTWDWYNALLEVFCLILALPTLTLGFNPHKGP